MSDWVNNMKLEEIVLQALTKVLIDKWVQENPSWDPDRYHYNFAPFCEQRIREILQERSM